MGLNEGLLSQEEAQQLRQANEMVTLTVDALELQRQAGGAFWLENPDHRTKLDLWKVNQVKRLINTGGTLVAKFDQCRFGAEVPKPTIFATYKLNLLDVHGKRCDHPQRIWTSPSGGKYRAAHESLVGRWRETSRRREKASKQLAEYPPALNRRLAQAMWVHTVREPMRAAGRRSPRDSP